MDANQPRRVWFHLYLRMSDFLRCSILRQVEFHQRQGPVLAARSVAERLPIPLWIHLDVDVLDREVFAATDYLMPGGLTLAELRLLLVELVDQVKVVGFSLACYNPDKDPDLSAGRALVSLLAEFLPLMDRGATGQGGT